MADARSLLQSERANRRIKHQYARYTDTGKLLCTLCDIAVKSDTAWNAHTRTPDHAKRALRAAEANAQSNSRKRKAGDDDEDTRKRRRSASADEVDDSVIQDGPAIEIGEESDDVEPAQPQIIPAPSQRPEQADQDDDPEWLELQRMIKESDTDPTTEGRATISAAPMTAEEVAAQAREELSSQRGRREAELEEEKEDANRALEEEFDEMGVLEERVKRLREKREALRKPGEEESGLAVNGILEVEPGGRGKEERDGADEEDEDEEYDELDEWNFGRD